MPSEKTTATPDQANSPVDNGNQQQRQDSQATAKQPRQQPEADQDDLKGKKSPQSSQLKTKLKKAWWLIPLVGLVLAIGGVSVMRLSPKDEEAATTTQTSPLPVRVTPAQLELIRAWVSSEGNVRATRFKHLTFDIDGDVTYIANREGGRQLREGDRVQKGELLARIDDRELEAQVSQAQAAVAEAKKQKSVATANLAQAQAQVAQARSQVQQAQAQLAKARSNRDLAQSQLERYRLLYNQGVVSASEFDTRQNTLQDAQAQIQAVQAQVNATQAQVNAAQAQVQAAREKVEAAETGITTARAQLTQANVDLEGTRLYAPFDGVVAYLNIRENEYYTPQLVFTQLAGEYQGILERVPIVVIDPNQFEVIADFPASSGQRIRPGKPAYIVSELDRSGERSNQTLIENARAKGEVFAVNPAVSPGGRSIQVTIRITDTTTNLQHGEQVSAWIAVEEEENTVVAPLDAFVYRDQQPYVFVVNPEEGVVDQRQIVPGITGIQGREIESGVSAGELLVTEGQNRLVDGTPVEIIERNQ